MLVTHERKPEREGNLMKHEFPASVAILLSASGCATALLGAMTGACGGGSGTRTNTTQTDTGGMTTAARGNGGSAANGTGNTNERPVSPT